MQNIRAEIIKNIDSIIKELKKDKKIIIDYNIKADQLKIKILDIKKLL